MEQAINIMKESANRLRDIIANKEPEILNFIKKEMLLLKFQ